MIWAAKVSPAMGLRFRLRSRPIWASNFSLCRRTSAGSDNDSSNSENGCGSSILCCGRGTLFLGFSFLCCFKSFGSFVARWDPSRGVNWR